MIKKKQDSPNNPPYWFCTNCNWPFLALRESIKHSLVCGQQKPQEPTFQSYTRKNEAYCNTNETD